MDSILVEYFKHNTWANLRVIDFCAGLPDARLDERVPGTFGSIRETLIHLAGAQERYLSRFTGTIPEQPPRESAGFPGFPELRERARQSSVGLEAIAAQIEPDPGRTIQITWQGQQQSLRASVLLIQVINHGTEHRAHIATTLGALGIEPPEIDGWSYGEATSSPIA